MEPPKLQTFLQKKKWIYNPNKDYDYYIGMKAYLCSKWDNLNKINFKNYGEIVEITSLYVCILTGYRTGYLELPIYIYYTHEEISYFYLKHVSNISIRKSYKNIMNDSIVSNRAVLEKEFLKNNFHTI